MKKYLIKISALVLGLTLTFACNEDLLEIPQKGVVDLATYYQNAGPDEAEALMVAIYNRYYSNIDGVVQKMFLDILSDDHHAGGGSFNDAASNFMFAGRLEGTSSHDNVNGMYNNAYNIIYRANLILERIPETSDERVNRVKAEADFFRALMMFELVRWFGTPPFVDHLLTPEEHNLPNGDHYEIITWCLERMQAAADVLPAIAGMGQQRAYGARISKHAALAYKGKVALWYGTRYNNNEILAQAVEPLKTVINSGLYGLLDDMFQIDRVAGDFSKEYIFEHNSEDVTGYASNQIDLRRQYVGWRIEHMSIPKDVGQSGWGWAPPSGNFGDFMKEYHGGDIENQRFKSTIHTWEQVLDKSYDESVTPGFFRLPLEHGEGYFRYRGLGFTDEKYTELTGTNVRTKANSYYMRYSEVLLMYAEAKFLTDDADGTGLAALNEVRRRAGIEELPSMEYQNIKDERRAELWAEGERYFDLVRWGDAATVLKDKGTKLYSFNGYLIDNYDKDDPVQFAQKRGNVKGGTPGKYEIEIFSGGSGWSNKYELLPFPYTQLGANPSLVQNPGW
ncbi:MAG: RagB/SusD family nutrient uptake outer membrane protein [Bacteroidales bacterium]|jgi:hypothetical protein|nr:RagB/SusD family nutrient uptake outer membrane protein [Bacteroidales bacterium]